MSQPADPYRGDLGYPYHEPDGPRSYGGQPYSERPYGAYGEPPYVPPTHQGPLRPAAPRAGSAVIGRPPRILRLGLVLILLSLVVQVLSLTMLPWVRFGANEPSSAAMPKIWQLVADYGGQGFSGWYVMLFSYPLAGLSIVLALASVLESFALKMIWGGLALIGLGVLAVRYGLSPLIRDQPHLSTREIVIAVIAIAILVAIIFVLRTAVSTFRRLAGLILLGITGVHVAAIIDLVNYSNAEQLSIGAYAPALGYLFTAIAAFIGPRRLLGFP